MNSKAPAKKKDDAAFDVEQQFILRLPPVWLLFCVAVFILHHYSKQVESVKCSMLWVAILQNFSELKPKWLYGNVHSPSFASYRLWSRWLWLAILHYILFLSWCFTPLCGGFRRLQQNNIQTW